jgi:hypothetical protein
MSGRRWSCSCRSPYPYGCEQQWTAVLTLGTALGAITGGTPIMAYPIVMLRLRSRPYFQQS